MRVPRPTAPILIALALLGTSTPAWAQGADEDASAAPAPPAPLDVREVAAHYRAARFDDCVRTAEQLLDPKYVHHATEPSEIDAATTYLGTCLVRTGHTEEAEDLFERWIYDGAKRNAVPAKPNVALYGGAAAEAYDVAYQRVSVRLENERKEALTARDKAKDDAQKREQAERKRQAALLELASRETVVVENRRWLASVPFGIGQFQNRKPGLGWLFLTSEAAAFGVTIGAMVVQIELESHSPQQRDPSREADSPTALTVKLDRAQKTWVVGFYAFTVLAAGGIAEAHLNYVPRFEEERQRPIPKELRDPVRPQARVRIGPIGLRGGAGLGVTGSF